FHDGEVVAFVQVFGHHDDIGGGRPPSSPRTTTPPPPAGSVVWPATATPPGRPGEGGGWSPAPPHPPHARHPRGGSSSAAVSTAPATCGSGAERLCVLFGRYGKAQVEGCFDAILDRTTETFKRELLSKIPDGTYVWEDYAEHDGVDPPKLHTQRMTLTKTAERL